jgi:hypothetical protein
MEFIKEKLKMEKPMDMEFLHTIMVIDMRDIGRMIKCKKMKLL